ncbi:cell division protein ZipA [Marinobacter halophilus]|uniref:Cell division protein ZipA n=1 Tax=Marinobacter halophilus TaxID=1323740 RepID=A0A2T1KH46_9GAMM|nr:cell division protein ZipA [Marinobacter halophilus]PSF09439.1 cell division protein ZipA [Marinobacter halophilus]GGC77785.1 cell division protein ZipA [Marinobacter halophilus]
MSLREWLIAIGTLVILGIVIDGVRRMRRARKESMAISSGMGADDLKDSPLDDDYNPELPNGGARTISRGTLEARGYFTSDTSEAFSSSDEDDITPETGWGAADEGVDDSELGEPRVVRSAPEQPEPEPEPVQQPGPAIAADSVDSEQPEPETVKKVEPAEVRTPHKKVPIVTSEVEEDTAKRAAVKPRKNQPLAGANRPEAREVLVINVLARSGAQFEGVILKKLFEACGLELGDMDIYHRHEGSDTTTPVQFSVANAVEPGTFRPRDMPVLSTPGISFFMSLPGPTNAMQAFEFMLETAQCVVRNMGGELKDERRSVMTPQTIEHCRQRIREFERKQRSQRV